VWAGGLQNYASVAQTRGPHEVRCHSVEWLNNSVAMLLQCRVTRQPGAEHASDVTRQQDVTGIHVVEDIIRLP
jgi:hypothetical protein